MSVFDVIWLKLTGGLLLCPGCRIGYDISFCLDCGKFICGSDVYSGRLCIVCDDIRFMKSEDKLTFVEE